MKKKSKKKPEWKKNWSTYSKHIIANLIKGYFILMVFAIVLVTNIVLFKSEYTESALSVITTLIECGSGLMTGGIVGYLIKSAVENKQKIKATGEFTSSPSVDEFNEEDINNTEDDEL